MPYEDLLWILITALSEPSWWTFSYLGLRAAKLKEMSISLNLESLRVEYDGKIKEDPSETQIPTRTGKEQDNILILRTTPKLNDIKEETHNHDWYINTALVRSYSTLPVWITFIDFILLDTSVGPQLESIRKASPFRSNLQRLYLVSIGRGPEFCWRGINLKTLGWLLYNLCWSKDNGKIF